MKRNPSRSLSKSLTDELAELRELDLVALKQRWRVLYRTEAPARIGRALLIQGVAYRLRVDNKGKETHEFTAPDFFKAVELRDAKPLNADHTEIVVQPGEHKDLYFVAKQAGSYKLICSDHDWAGMVGSITVSP